MRILSGTARGRLLQSPSGLTTRPTEARSREMIFNVLAGLIEEARFVDCYAGSGSVGLEALSLGAGHCVFIEQDPAAARTIRANLKTLGWEKRALVWQGDVRQALTRFEKSQQKFEIIFADPPFDHATATHDFCKKIDSIAQILIDRDAELSDNDTHESSSRPEIDSGQDGISQNTGLLVLQHHCKMNPEQMSHFRLVRQKRAGESTVSFFHPIGSHLAPDARQDLDEPSA